MGNIKGYAELVEKIRIINPEVAIYMETKAIKLKSG